VQVTVGICRAETCRVQMGVAGTVFAVDTVLGRVAGVKQERASRASGHEFGGWGRDEGGEW